MNVPSPVSNPGSGPAAGPGRRPAVQYVSRFSTCTALVIDSRAESAQRTVQLLRSMGMGEVQRVARPRNGRALLAEHAFDFLFCDYDFEDSPTNGQDFVDELRQDRILPYSTVVFFVTSEAGRAKVSHAAESGLDQYLLKPFTEASFTRRVEGSRMRKLALRPIFDAMNREDFESTVALCEAEIANDGKYWLVAAQIGAEACIRTHRLERAQELYARILAHNAVPWARLGVARVEAQRGDLEQAQLTLRSLISDHPFYVDAYDVLGRCQMERGQFDSALDTFRTASRLTPACIRRLQKVAHVAFLTQQSEVAGQALSRAVVIGRESRLLDMQSVLLLCLTRFDEGALPRLERAAELLRSAAGEAPDSYRLARFVEVAETLLLLAHGRTGDALEAAHRMSLRVQEPQFDFEAAGNFLYLLDRFDRSGFRLVETRVWTQAIALRFCVSRVAVDLLRNCARVPSYCEIIDEAAREISETAKAAVAKLIDGARLEALQDLAAAGERTLNARLLEIGHKITERHAEPDFLALRERIETIQAEYCAGGTQAALQFRHDRQPVPREPGSRAPTED